MESISDSTILVTGGAGFIGSNIVERLADKNKIYVIDNMHTGTEKNLRSALETGNVELIKDDVANINKYDIKPDYIFHLGIYSSAPMYKENPLLVAEAIKGAIAILDLAKKNNSKIVITSSSSIYNGLEPPHKEDLPLKVTDLYTEGRIAIERLAEFYSNYYGIDAVALRLFSVYGKHEEYKGRYANLVSQFIWAISKGEQPVIYGDGTQTRDFINIDDVVDAYIKAALKADGFEAYNVGTGKSYTLNELVSILNKKLDKDIAPKYVENPIKNYVRETQAYTEKAKRKLGFEAKISLEEGIDRTIRYYREIGFI
ncbi:MAG: ADP-L-glycero-D-manno-heptose-6-epimerase [Candidatus Micrarchaeota archaeon]|nr:MAG: ADP-L-glycero-D-manno-heptose-6-epimerase [Candidatus Micrarchaeota archaeon]